MNMRHCAALGLALLLTASAPAAEYRVEALEEGPPAELLSKEIAEQIEPEGIRVIRGEKTTLGDIWLRKAVPSTAERTAPDIIYPFKEGELVGVLRLARRASDFREEDISRGVYTLRYSLQPVDGAHVGTSPTRDFLLLLSAEQDQSTKPLDYKTLVAQSAEVAGSAHPALLSMQRVVNASDSLVRHDERHDWTIIRLKVKAAVGDKVKEVPVDLVIDGVAAE